MAIIRAVKTGNWSDTTVWNTGALPTSSDDVYSNTFTVTIDTSPTVLSISNAAATGVTAGGAFVPTNGITLTCTANNGLVASTAGLLVSSLAAGNSFNIVGNTVSGSTTGAVCVNNGSTGSIVITGNVSAGGGSNAHGLTNGSSGSIAITGNVTGGTSNGSVYGVQNASTGSVSITGNVTGGTGSSSDFGVNNASTGTVTITGTVAGGSVNQNNGANNASTGALTIIGTVQSTNGSVGVSGAIGGTTILTGPFLTSSSGVAPVAASRWFWQNTTPPATYYQIRSANLSVIRPLYTADSVGGNPAVGNVRSGTVYGPNSELTGTCAVPGAASVVVGVPVDNTTGTAAVTAATIRAAVGLASPNLDSQLAAIPTTAAPTAAAIRTEMDSNSTKLANLDATVSSRLAASSYSAAPSAATNATAVRSELATELGRIDATVSSRLAPSGTLARVTLTDTATTLTNAPTVPSAAEISAEVWSTSVREVTGGTVDNVTNSTPVDATEIAEAVRTELTPELARVANAATTQEVGDIVEEAMQP